MSITPSAPLKHFLLVFDHAAGQLIRHDEFDDVNEALRAYRRAEDQYDHSADMEVVLIGSDSFETVRETHANYFDGTAALAKALVEIVHGFKAG
jgi:hypothetical protein